MSQTSTQTELPIPIPPRKGSSKEVSVPQSTLAMVSASTEVLPAFRSTSTFPRSPKPEQLPGLYSDCLQALKEANTARRIHKRRMEARKQVIAAVRLEIARLEQDLALEASTRARLHAMNLRLVSALQTMDGLAGELDALVQEAHQIPRSRLGRLIDSLKALVQQWRSLKRHQRQEMTGLAGSEQDGAP